MWLVKSVLNIEYKLAYFSSVQQMRFFKMKFTVIFLLFSVKCCNSNEFECGCFDDKLNSVEFYCENVQESLPINCTKSFLYSINSYDKLKVTQLKIGGCDEDKISGLIEDFQNIHSLDISCSNLQSLGVFKKELKYLIKLNASHNQLNELFDLTEYPNVIWEKMPQLTEVHLSHNNLNWIWNFPKTVKKIDVSHNRMEQASSRNLTNNHNLEYVDLSHNLLEEINDECLFTSARHLKTLRLEDNRYTRFNGKFLPLLRKGCAVHFSWKSVTEFEIVESLGKPIRVFTNSQRDGDFTQKKEQNNEEMEEGILSSPNGKIEFHCNEGSFENLKLFQFIGNHIENPSDLIRCLTPSIGRLELSGKFSEHLNFTLLERFINLWTLTVNNAQITEFDINSLKNWKQLFALNLSYNNLKRISNIFLLKNLHMHRLEFADNQLENAPEFIQHLPLSTYVINLSGNYVGKLNTTTFEHSIMRIINLSNTSLSFDDISPFEPIEDVEEINISYNNLGNTNFTSNSTCFKRLQILYAAHCNITNASELIKRLGPSISILDLSGNNLVKLDAKVFAEFTLLRILNVSSTNLIEIDFDMFKHTFSFYEVNFSNNQLKNIKITSPMTSLELLHLDRNELTEIESLTTSNFPNLSKLSISNNQIPCIALARLKQQCPNLKYFNNPLQQTHSECSSVNRLINNLGFVGTFISNWL